MPGNEIGDRVHNFFAEDISMQGQHQSHVLEGNWPLLNNNYRVGSQRQIDALNSSSKNYPSQNSEIEQASYPLHAPHGLNFSQANLRPDTSKTQCVSEQQYSNGVVYGNRFHQNRQTEANFLAVDNGSNLQHVLSSRGLSFPETQQGSGREQEKALDRLGTSIGPVSLDLFGGQSQMNHQQASMLQALQRQQSGLNDMQQMQQQIMMRKMQEFQMQQQLKQLDLRSRDLVNQVPTLTKQTSDSQSNMVHENSNSDALQYPWTAEAGSSWLNGTSAMGGSPSRLVFPQTLAGAQRSVDVVHHQADQSLYGVPVSTSWGLPANQYPQMIPSKSSMPQMEALSNSVLASQPDLLSDRVGVQESTPISRPKFQIENIEHVSSQSLNTGIADGGLHQQANSMPRNEPQHHFAGRQEPSAQSETSHERSTRQFSSSPSEAALDPTEEKILYGSDDNLWAAFDKSPNMSGATTGNLFDNGRLSNGFPSIQCGSWSALMQSAVAETSSSDTGLQEEWSGLNFLNNDGSSANQATLMHNDYVKRASLSKDEGQIPSTLNSGSLRFSRDINAGNALESKQFAHKFGQEPDIRVSTHTSQIFRQSLDESSKWSNHNTPQKSVAEGSQMYEIASQHSLEAERDTEKVCTTWVPGQTGSVPERNGWDAQAAIPTDVDRLKNHEAQLPQKLQNHRSMVMQDVRGNSLWKSNSPSSATDIGPVKVGNHMADKGILSLNNTSAPRANSRTMGVDDGTSSFIPNDNSLIQWKNAYPQVKFQGSDRLGSNQGLDPSNKSSKGEFKRHDMENSVVKEISSGSHCLNLSQHASGHRREAGFSDPCESRSLLPGKLNLANQLTGKVSVPRKFQYHPMGNLDEDVEPNFRLKQHVQIQSSSLNDEGENPKDNKVSSNEATYGSFPGSNSRISFPFNRPLDSYALKKVSSPSQNMLELLHKVDQSRNDGAMSHLSSSDCNILSQPPEAEKSDGSAGHIQHSSISKGFGLQLGPPSQRVHAPDLSLPPQNARDMVKSMHTSRAGAEMRDKMLQVSSVQSSLFSNEGSRYENHRFAGLGNHVDENSLGNAPGNYQLALDTSHSSHRGSAETLPPDASCSIRKHSIASYGGTAGASNTQASGPAATEPTSNHIHSSQHFGMPGNSQQVLQNIWNNISPSPHFLASQYPKAPSHLSAPCQPNIVKSSPHADLHDSRGDHLSSGLTSIHANSQSVVDEEEHRFKASAKHIEKIGSSSKVEEPLGKISSTKDTLEESPANSASTQKDIEAFGRSLKPNAFSNKKYALNQMSIVEDAETDPGIRVSKRMKGADNIFTVHPFHTETGQQNEDNAGDKIDSSTGVLSEDSRIFKISSSSDMMRRDTAPYGNIASQDNVVTGVDNSQYNPSSDCTTSVRSDNHQVAPQMAPSWFNQYGHYKNGQIFPVYNAHNVVSSFRPIEPSSTVKSSSIMDTPSLVKNSPTASFGAWQDGSNLKSALTSVINEHLSSSQSLQPIVMGEHQMILRPQKRKTATSKLHSWQKEISDGSQISLVLSATEGDWCKTANRPTEKVQDDSDLSEDGSPLLRPKRRLILTTQLMQQLFRPLPASILSADSCSTHESVTYGVSRTALGDACSAIYCSSDIGRRDCPDLHSMKGKLNGDAHFAKVIEDMLGKAGKLAEYFLRLEKNASMLDLRFEIQEVEKFSVINRFARFHGRLQNDNAEVSSIPYLQRYVLALPMPGNPPDKVQCLSL